MRALTFNETQLIHGAGSFGNCSTILGTTIGAGAGVYGSVLAASVIGNPIGLVATCILMTTASTTAGYCMGTVIGAIGDLSVAISNQKKSSRLKI